MNKHDDFSRRHLGSSAADQAHMLQCLDCPTLEALLEQTIPAEIRLRDPLQLPAARSEAQALTQLRTLMQENHVLKSFYGQGYYGCHTPPVIQRNVLENPGWYTAYTPYQAEIAQGRLEALMVFQTLICDLTGLDVANASLLDEATAAAEAMSMALAQKPAARHFFVSSHCHPQTLAVLQTRADPLGISLEISDPATWNLSSCADLLAVLLPYPDTWGEIRDPSALFAEAKKAGALCLLAADPLALTLLKTPADCGADICIGSTQRFGIPLGFGGPHAAFMACTDALKRKLPGRLVGATRDARGKLAYRLALQTREQHIRRDKATSNICTAQVLLAVMAAMYAVYHGPEGLQAMAEQIRHHRHRLHVSLEAAGIPVHSVLSFDALVFDVADAAQLVDRAARNGYLLRQVSDTRLAIACDETTEESDLATLLSLLCPGQTLLDAAAPALPAALSRQQPLLPQSVFHRYHSETAMLRYLKRLESKDLALNESMIPLGSCTMKLNATSEMMPLSWPEVAQLHPFCGEKHSRGYLRMLSQLEHWLAVITGFHATSLQPNAGSQGEYAGLLAIRRYHRARQQEQRRVCLIPVSAHGTNPASAVMAGMQVVVVPCDAAGNIDAAALEQLIATHRQQLAALMITYPSTHGVFEENIRQICDAVHDAGGLVYLDGANMNAQVGLTSPARIGADVCHLNLHKTFCIPHGGGGPGVGPIAVNERLAPYLPGNMQAVGELTDGAVSACAYGSASINTIAWMYIALMGPQGLRAASAIAILHANYIAQRLQHAYPILFTGSRGRVAHECIIDLRPLTAQSGITVEDVAKRLIDYGFHAPTMSWPVAGTLMIEPTESESLEELDRFCEALLGIRAEIQDIIEQRSDRNDNPLKHAPHPAESVLASDWPHAYTREQAAYPMAHLREHKFWPAVARIDNVHGDRHLVCSCDPVSSYSNPSS